MGAAPSALGASFVPDWLPPPLLRLRERFSPAERVVVAAAVAATQAFGVGLVLVHLGRFTVATVVAHQVSILVVLVAATVLLLAAASEEPYAEGDDLAHLTLQSSQTGAIAPGPAAAGDDPLSPLLAGEGLGPPLE